ncbi:ras-related protein Rab-7L1 isoform X2 [Protopterus annectens]|uniref:ras-related protein Rab-7L1 isoform X2 n=1 Tax=Protopterus annectens TaxID=7888 RepID=UPI001CFB96CB|nr:ras-related protein Rab-7L1 isoform X2 [Protopterus annectens]
MDIQEYTIKVLIIGDPTVGKTSVVQRYTRNFFSHRYKTTIGVDFDLKVLQWSETEMLKLHLWDIAGQEFHTKLTRVYYKSASACVILFDVTKQQTFKNSLLWKQDLDENVTLSDGHPVPCILFANKVVG